MNRTEGRHTRHPRMRLRGASRMWFHFIIVLAAGAMLPMQAGINAGLARLGHPLWRRPSPSGGTPHRWGGQVASRRAQLAAACRHSCLSWSGGVLGPSTSPSW
ncbi:hypothetical protein DSL92_03625 [Billgrantia gudaonensis]|uniref:Uncharacterized protein n=1 Tax=Billgrantia gudaonensis TaxID=376427 RepID=A0A432JJP8_9GAMM|nr:hypothetical protein DSL92_03625 [Halomonas gudaonensis]